MQKLLAKCCRFVGYFKYSALATNHLDEKQKALGFKPTWHVHVVQEVATRWNHTYHMLQRLALLKQPIRLYLEDSMPEQASFDLSDVEWVIAKGVINLLEAVDGVTSTL